MDTTSPNILTGSNATDNAWKIICKAKLDSTLQQNIAVLYQEAAQNGLMPELLDKLLRAELV